MVRKAYRIENDEGLGPFANSVVKPAVDAAYGAGTALALRCDPYEMPAPHSDSRPLRSHHAALELTPTERDAWVYAFPTVEALRRWFRPAVLAQLAKHGYRVNLYQVDDASRYVASETQVLFHRPSCTLIRRYA
jgi:hypothetical protein